MVNHDALVRAFGDYARALRSRYDVGGTSTRSLSPPCWPTMATGYILNAGELEEARTRTQRFQHALDSRIIIEQAKGILAERNQITPSEAFERLRRHSRHTQSRIHDVAAQVVDGTPTL